MRTPQNGDLWCHYSSGLVLIVKPWNAKESVAELIKLRPQQVRRLLMNELMEPVAIRDTAGVAEVCVQCKKKIRPGNDCYRIDSPANEFGPDLKGTVCAGCINELCHSLGA